MSYGILSDQRTYQEVDRGKYEKGGDDWAEAEPGPQQGRPVGSEPGDAPVELLRHPAQLQRADLEA